MASSSSPSPSDSAPTDSDALSSSEGSEREAGEPAPPSPPAQSAKRKRTSQPYMLSTSNVYNAASSRITVAGRPLNPSHTLPAAADEILFYNPTNPNFTLPDEVDKIMKDEGMLDALPDSDLLKAVHAYVADYYAAKGWTDVGARSMDEGALIAIGVLLEEYCREMIGKQGDQVFVEQEEQ
ncbi:hypothetical protein TWF696_002670 [Orbilia brochopaga]|uniref:Uncharacterized protein n=1 Tax=Orbilia brochopaga TaxID=3140254 RepID=A0AAV9U686_9PEZI